MFPQFPKHVIRFLCPAQGGFIHVQGVFYKVYSEPYPHYGKIRLTNVHLNYLNIDAPSILWLCTKIKQEVEKEREELRRSKLKFNRSDILKKHGAENCSLYAAYNYYHHSSK